MFVCIEGKLFVFFEICDVRWIPTVVVAVSAAVAAALPVDRKQ
jgi:hypothetical protein